MHIRFVSWTQCLRGWSSVKDCCGLLFRFIAVLFNTSLSIGCFLPGLKSSIPIDLVNSVFQDYQRDLYNDANTVSG